MSNMVVKDGNGTLKSLNTTGSGTDADPYVPAHTFSEIFPTADADLTQKITVVTAGSPQQGPDKSNTNGWLIQAASSNSGAAYFMFHGQTAAAKGFPLFPGSGVIFVPVVDLNSLDFDVTTNGNSVMASKV